VNGPRPAATSHRLTRPTSYALAYGFGALAWIVLSDVTVRALGGDSLAVNIGKGVSFIVATAVMLWALLRRHERRVNEADQRARDEVIQLVDQSSDVVHLVGLDGRFLLVNRVVGRMLGVEPQDAIGQKRETLIEGVVGGDLTTDADVRARGEAIVSMEEVGDEANRRRFRSTRFPVRAANGEIVAIGTIAVDVSDEERVQQQLRDSEAAYRMMFDTALLPLWIHDASTLQMVAVNDAAMTEYGYSHADFLQLHLADLWPRAGAEAEQHRSQVGGSTHTTLVDASGHLIEVEMDASPTVYDGRPSILVLTRDVTLEHQATERDRLLLQLPSLFEAADPGTFLPSVVEQLVRLTHSTGGFHSCTCHCAPFIVGEAESSADRRLVVTIADDGAPGGEVTLWGKPFDYTPADELACRMVGLQSHQLVEREHFVHDLEAAALQQEATLEGVARTVGAIVDTRDAYTAGHQHRVGELAVAIGTRLGLPEADIAGLRIGGYLHDVGKIATPFELLTRPGPLDPLEREIVERHSRTGRDLLAPVPFPWPIAQMIDQHHERLDGSGYPAGLHGDEIIPQALIIAVADVFDAITSTRPYRPGRSPEIAISELRRGAGHQYDAAAVEALIACVEELDASNRIAHPEPA
jgi:PAS domain S-box-containing protein